MDTPRLLAELQDHTSAWDWENSHVSQAYVENAQSPGGVQAGKPVSINDIVESGTVLIASGPADLGVASDVIKNPNGFRIVPIGFVETAQISMNKPLSRIFEIGSMLSYIIPGRVVGGISLSRVFFDGPSLLKAMYTGEVKEDAADEQFKYAQFISNAETTKDAYRKFAHIGSGNLAMNLASRFFNQPVGLAFFFKDQKSDQVSQIYFEGCQVGTWNMGISANMNVLTEAINMEFIRCRPIITATSANWERGKTMADINIVSDKTNDPSALSESAKG
jgi:hypothetical protein